MHVLQRCKDANFKLDYGPMGPPTRYCSKKKKMLQKKEWGILRWFVRCIKVSSEEWRASKEIRTEEEMELEKKKDINC